MVIWSFLLIVVQSAWGLQYNQHTYDSLGQKADVSQLIASVQEGDVVIIGEKHGFYPHHQMQKSVVQSLQNLGFQVDVGIEHVPYPMQNELDVYVNGKSTEDEFLKALGWRKSSYASCQEYTEQDGFENPFESTPFDCYIQTLRQANDKGGKALAINLPRTITSKISRNGMGALTPEEEALLPPNYSLGSNTYFERFRELILSFGNRHGTVSDEMIEKMFVSQSLWDETMAWTSLEHMQAHPKNVMVITVGDFHAAYGDGLAARFYARGAKKVHIISQDAAENATQAELDLWGKPDPKWGSAGDLVIITNVVR